MSQGASVAVNFCNELSLMKSSMKYLSNNVQGWRNGTEENQKLHGVVLLFFFWVPRRSNWCLKVACLERSMQYHCSIHRFQHPTSNRDICSTLDSRGGTSPLPEVVCMAGRQAVCLSLLSLPGWGTVQEDGQHKEAGVVRQMTVFMHIEGGNRQTKS